MKNKENKFFWYLGLFGTYSLGSMIFALALINFVNGIIYFFTSGYWCWELIIMLGCGVMLGLGQTLSMLFVTHKQNKRSKHSIEESNQE